MFNCDNSFILFSLLTIFYIADLMDRSQAENVIDRIIADFGAIDVLVNNAGMVQVGGAEDFSEFVDVSYESWDVSSSRNLTLCFNVTRRVLPHMRSRKYGRIVNVSSVTGPVVSNPGEAAYSAAKAAVIGMSRSIAIEVANMIVFLASKEASYITGQTFIVDGGNTIQEYKGPSELYY